MKKQKFTETQIIKVLKKYETGTIHKMIVALFYSHYNPLFYGKLSQTLRSILWVDTRYLKKSNFSGKTEAIICCLTSVLKR